MSAVTILFINAAIVFSFVAGVVIGYYVWEFFNEHKRKLPQQEQQESVQVIKSVPPGVVHMTPHREYEFAKRHEEVAE